MDMAEVARFERQEHPIARDLRAVASLLEEPHHHGMLVHQTRHTMIEEYKTQINEVWLCAVAKIAFAVTGSLEFGVGSRNQVEARFPNLQSLFFNRIIGLNDGSRRSFEEIARKLREEADNVERTPALYEGRPDLLARGCGCAACSGSKHLTASDVLQNVAAYGQAVYFDEVNKHMEKMDKALMEMLTVKPMPSSWESAMVGPLKIKAPKKFTTSPPPNTVYKSVLEYEYA